MVWAARFGGTSKSSASNSSIKAPTRCGVSASSKTAACAVTSKHFPDLPRTGLASDRQGRRTLQLAYRLCPFTQTWPPVANRFSGKSASSRPEHSKWKSTGSTWIGGAALRSQRRPTASWTRTFGMRQNAPRLQLTRSVRNSQ